MSHLAIIPACLTCGACCFGPGERYVPVSGADHARLGELAERYTVFLGNRCYMRMQDGHCAALELRADGQFVCRLYEHRPQVCRDLERGAPACQAELTQKREISREALLKRLRT